MYLGLSKKWRPKFAKWWLSGKPWDFEVLNFPTLSGWWLTYSSEKYELLVCWDDDIPNIWKKMIISLVWTNISLLGWLFQTTNQLSICSCCDVWHVSTKVWTWFLDPILRLGHGEDSENTTWHSCYYNKYRYIHIHTYKYISVSIYIYVYIYIIQYIL